MAPIARREKSVLAGRPESFRNGRKNGSAIASLAKPRKLLSIPPNPTPIKPKDRLQIRETAIR